jgi:hypothetical protein
VCRCVCVFVLVCVWVCVCVCGGVGGGGVEYWYRLLRVETSFPQHIRSSLCFPVLHNPDRRFLSFVGSTWPGHLVPQNNLIDKHSWTAKLLVPCSSMHVSPLHFARLKDALSKVKLDIIACIEGQSEPTVWQPSAALVPVTDQVLITLMKSSGDATLNALPGPIHDKKASLRSQLAKFYDLLTQKRTKLTRDNQYQKLEPGAEIQLMFNTKQHASTVSGKGQSIYCIVQTLGRDKTLKPIAVAPLPSTPIPLITRYLVLAGL